MDKIVNRNSDNAIVETLYNEISSKININDKVQVAGETIRNEKKVYILFIW